MDVASRLSLWRDSPSDQWLNAANRYLPPIVMALLVFLLAWRLAELTWLIVPGQPVNSPAPEMAPMTQTAPASARGTSLAALADAHLFGTAPDEPAAPIVELAAPDAPETTLNLVLNGVQARDDFRVGEAIISSGRNQQKTYYIGDTIEGGNGAVLEAIYSDRVLLNRAGRVESLRLPQESAGSTGRSGIAPPQALSLRPSAPQIPSGSGSLRDVIGNNASRISQIMRFAPQLEQGQMVGFRITPGRDRDAFSALGLEPGDVITDINGMTLNDPQGGLQVFETLGETSVANITVVRNGAPQSIAIDTTQLENLAENLQ